MAVAGATSASSGATASEQARKLRTLPFPTMTTPARLRLGGIVLVGALAVLAIVGVRTALDRAAAADAVAGDATPLLVGAENLYVALADADAAASTAFLRAGLEPPNLRARYLDDLETAGRQLADLATQSNPSATSSAAIAQIAQLLPAYAGQVEAARTNNRLDFPLGAAYLRRASDSMRTSILPAAKALYDDAARQLYGAYADGTAARDRELLLVVTGVVMAILIVVQVMVALRTRRVLNLGLVGAMVIVAALGVGALIVLDAQERALVRSQREGADQLIVLSTMRILALRSLSDENLNLIERGTEAEYQEDLAAVTESIGATDGSGGLLGNAALFAERTGRSSVIDQIRERWVDYVAALDRVQELDDSGAYRQAVDAAVTDGADAASRVDAALDAELAVARQGLDAHTTTARDHVRWLGATVVMAVGLAVLLVAGGLWARLREYR